MAKTVAANTQKFCEVPVILSWKKSLCELCAYHSLSPVLNKIQTGGNILNTRFSAGQEEGTETCFSRI
jgi:hypothetical protein